MENILFPERINFADREFLNNISIKDIESIDVIPVFIDVKTGGCEWDVEPSNAYSIFIRYTREYSKNNNPSWWVADLDTLKAANRFAELLRSFFSLPSEL